MIITCNNCNKKFDIDSSLIPDKGRLLQCAGCDHKWFFKKEVLKNTVNPIVKDFDNEGLDIFDQNKRSNNNEINPSELPIEEIEVDIEEGYDEKIKVNNEEEPKIKIDANINESIQVNTKQKNFKILNIFIVAIISFVAFIIIVDTFKYPIGKIVPNTELILYNLYESIKDISLFIKDLT
ncbi:zinc-ribbon domain-containing protein [Candidatus Pelagibacter sp. Uisw_113]|uniref:zinc-ribbon domain-containing protein n=1 Tax=Candidatus Pelagibacter sp. Uisw_113 TaxID=3230994 RepID=UPI0039E75158